MKYLILNICLLVSSIATAQNVLNAKSPEELRKQREQRYEIGAGGDTVSTKQKVLPYGFIEDKDILWSKVTWEVIDLEERINQIYYHSSDGLVSANLSLYEALVDGIKSGKITEVYDDEYFMQKITNPLSRTESVRESDELIDLMNEGVTITDDVKKQYTDVFKVHNEYVRYFKIKGLWYVDKRLGEMKYRLLGIAPMGPDAQSIGREFENANELIPLFWIWYDSARETLANYVVFNPKNNASHVTYDDLLNVRRFNSIIYKSDTGFSDGTIEKYLPKDAASQLEESNAIKYNIQNYESDLWNY